MKGNEKGFYRYISSKRKTRENVDMLLKTAGDLVTRTQKRPSCSMYSLPWSLLVRWSLRNPRPLTLVEKSRARKTYP